MPTGIPKDEEELWGKRKSHGSVAGLYSSMLAGGAAGIGSEYAGDAILKVHDKYKDFNARRKLKSLTFKPGGSPKDIVENFNNSLGGTSPRTDSKLIDKLRAKVIDRKILARVNAAPFMGAKESRLFNAVTHRGTLGMLAGTLGYAAYLRAKAKKSRKDTKDAKPVIAKSSDNRYEKWGMVMNREQIVKLAKANAFADLIKKDGTLVQNEDEAISQIHKRRNANTGILAGLGALGVGVHGGGLGLLHKYHDLVTAARARGEAIPTHSERLADSFTGMAGKHKGRTPLRTGLKGALKAALGVGAVVTALHYGNKFVDNRNIRKAIKKRRELEGGM